MADLTIGDFILLPIYLFILSLISKSIRSKYKNNPNLTFYFKWAFRIKMLLVIMFTLLLNFVMRGDSVDLYFTEGKNFANIITSDFSKIDLLFTQGGEKVNDLIISPYNEGFLKSETGYMVVKICVVICFFSFSKLMIVNLICAFMAFLGSWHLFLFFREQRPHLEKQFAIACMFVPTVIFWSAGISKDVICMASLGFLTWSLWVIIIHKKKVISNIIVVAICGYLMYAVKPYILFSYLPFCIYYLLSIYVKNVKNDSAKIFFKLIIAVLFLAGIVYLYTSGSDVFSSFSSEEILKSVSWTQESFINQAKTMDGSFFTLGDFDGTLLGFIKMTPSAVGTTLFRPFLWETRNLVMLLSALESLVILWLALKNLYSAKRILNFFKCIFNDPLVVYCFAFSIIFAAFVGISTFNFGSLVRYKIPAVPFFLITLFIISDSYTKKYYIKKIEN